MPNTEFFYRYEEITYSLGVDDFDNPLPGYRLEVNLNKYQVTKRTAKGVWIQSGAGIVPPRFVLDGARRRFACPTIPEAKESFLARKNRQITILQKQIDKAKEAIYLVEHEDIAILQ